MERKQGLSLMVVVFFLFISAVICSESRAVDADPLDNWTWRNPITLDKDLYGVAYGVVEGAYKWVVVGDGIALTSTDMQTWDVRLHEGTTFQQVKYGNQQGMYGNGVFVATGGGQAYCSDDGLTWNAGSFAGDTTGNIQAVAFNGKMWVGVGQSTHIFTSSDCMTWTATTGKMEADLNAVAYGNDIWLATGHQSGHTKVFTSNNGIDWYADTGTHWVSPNSYGKQMAYGGGLFVAVSNIAEQELLNTHDGFDWLAVALSPTTLPERLFSVTNGNETFVTVGSQGTVLTSGVGLLIRHGCLVCGSCSSGQRTLNPAASFRLHLAVDTLAVRLTVPPVGPVEDLHLQVSAPCRAHQNKKGGNILRHRPSSKSAS